MRLLLSSFIYWYDYSVYRKCMFIRNKLTTIFMKHDPKETVQLESKKQEPLSDPNTPSPSHLREKQCVFFKISSHTNRIFTRKANYEYFSYQHTQRCSATPRFWYTRTKLSLSIAWNNLVGVRLLFWPSPLSKRLVIRFQGRYKAKNDRCIFSQNAPNFSIVSEGIFWSTAILFSREVFRKTTVGSYT